MTRKRGREAMYTPDLMRSLCAVVPHVYKIPDPRMGAGSKRPYDIMGMMRGGRHLAIEAKQVQKNSTGTFGAFRLSQVADHQLDALTDVALNGGVAYVAMFSWTRGSGLVHLFMLEFRALMAMWERHPSVAHHQLVTLDPLPSRMVVTYERGQPVVDSRGKPKKVRSWDLSAWAARYESCR